MSSRELLTASNVILDSLSDGVYVCDKDRRIVFWSQAAARITGWEPADVIGRQCLDDVLAHVDKDGHRLCGEEFCPLHRAMVTGTQSTVGLIVFARGKEGNRIPMQVTVAPIRDPAGEIIGGVETFRDVSAVLADLERAKRIQALSLETDLPDDPRVTLLDTLRPARPCGRRFLRHQATGRRSLWIPACRRDGTRGGCRPAHHAPELLVGPALPPPRSSPWRLPRRSTMNWRGS